MKLKIISDGTSSGTSIVNAETGETINGIVSVDWSVSADSGCSEVNLRVMGVQLELVGQAAIELLPAYAAVALLEGK